MVLLAGVASSSLTPVSKCGKMRRALATNVSECGSSHAGRSAMRFATQVTIQVSRQSVWDFLWDVPRLTACVPGCEAVQEIEPNTRYQAVVRDKVGPFTLRVPLAVEVLEATAPARLRARAQDRKSTRLNSSHL